MGVTPNPFEPYSLFKQRFILRAPLKINLNGTPNPLPQGARGMENSLVSPPSPLSRSVLRVHRGFSL